MKCKLGQYIDLSGQKLGKLTVIKRVEDHITPSGQHKQLWLCRCDCGNENNTSGYTGVYYHKPSGCWVAYTKINKKQIRKYYKTKEEAIQGRIMLENEYFKEYAYRNCMEESK